MLNSVHKEIVAFFKYCNLSEPNINIVEDSDVSIHIIEIETAEQLLFLKDGKELLFAFQSIFKKIIHNKFPETLDFVVDIDGEQKKRIEEAKQKAHIAYKRVIQYQKPYSFGYLNGFERMIIHSYLKEKKEVKTVSRGEGRERRLWVEKNH